jgi:hypothetical protein
LSGFGGHLETGQYPRWKDREPWLFATSLAPSSALSKKVVGLYKLRMQIEVGRLETSRAAARLMSELAPL